MVNTFIQLNRKILSWQWYTNANVARVFIHCLIKANYKEKKWHDIDVKQGTFITSYATLSDELGLTRDQIRGALQKLKESGEITTQPTNKYLVVIVSKYKEYQTGNKNGEGDDPIQEPGEDQSETIQNTTTNKENKGNNDIIYSTTREIKNICQSEEVWVEAVKSNYVLSQKQFDDYLEKFTNFSMVQGKTTHSTEDFKKHFILWYQKYTGKGMNGRKLLKYKKPTL